MHQRLRTLALSLVALATCIAAPVAAAEHDIERTLAIIELRGGTDQNSLTVDYLREVMAAFKEENTGDYILVPGEKIAEKMGRNRDQVPGAVTDERRKALAEAKQKGIAFLDNADATNAIKALQAAESKYRATLAAPGADDGLRKEYLDVLAQLATAYVVAKDRDAAAEVFRVVITTFGLKARITDDNYRPDVVDLFKSVVKEVNQLQKGAVDVASTPIGAHIILGGIDRGATPLMISDLIPGIYTLRLQQGANTSMLHRVKINGGATTKIAIDLPFESHLVLEDKNVGLSYTDLEAAKARVQLDATALGRDLGVNMVCVIGVIGENLVSYVVDVGQSKVERSAIVKVPGVGTSKRAVTPRADHDSGREDAGRWRGAAAANRGPALVQERAGDGGRGRRRGGAGGRPGLFQLAVRHEPGGQDAGGEGHDPEPPPDCRRRARRGRCAGHHVRGAVPS